MHSAGSSNNPLLPCFSPLPQVTEGDDIAMDSGQDKSVTTLPSGGNSGVSMVNADKEPAALSRGGTFCQWAAPSLAGRNICQVLAGRAAGLTNPDLLREKGLLSSSRIAGADEHPNDRDFAVLPVHSCRKSSVYKLSNNQFLSFQDEKVNSSMLPMYQNGCTLWSKFGSQWYSSQLSNMGVVAVRVLAGGHILTIADSQATVTEAETGKHQMVTFCSPFVPAALSINDGRAFFVLDEEREGQVYKDMDGQYNWVRCIKKPTESRGEFLSGKNGDVYYFRNSSGRPPDGMLMAVNRQGALLRHTSDEGDVGAWREEFEGQNVISVATGNQQNIQAVVVGRPDGIKVVKFWSVGEEQWVDVFRYDDARVIKLRQLSPDSLIACFYGGAGGKPSPQLHYIQVVNGVSKTRQLCESLPGYQFMLGACIGLEDGRVVTVEESSQRYRGLHEKIVRLFACEGGQWDGITLARFKAEGFDGQTCKMIEAEPGVLAVSLAYEGEIRLYDLYRPSHKKENF